VIARSGDSPPSSYDPSWRALLAPGTLSAFPEGPPGRPFDPYEGPTPSNARWLIGLSHLAYHPSSRYAGELRRIGMRLETVLPGARPLGFVARGRTHAVVVFRGTGRSPVEIGYDLDTRLVRTRVGRVHAGFRRGLRLVRDTLESSLDRLAAERVPVVYTGHSLGGALALVAAAERPADGVATFGAPRTGDRRFARSLASGRVRRFENGCDLVCRLPPRELGFSHAGVRALLASEGPPLRLEPSDRERRRVRRESRAGHRALRPWRRRLVPVRDLCDHSVVNYSRLLERVSRAG